MVLSFEYKPNADNLLQNFAGNWNQLRRQSEFDLMRLKMTGKGCCFHCILNEAVTRPRQGS